MIPAASAASGSVNPSRPLNDCLVNQAARSTAPVLRTRRAARPTSSPSIARTSSANPGSGSSAAAARAAASTPSRRKIRGTSKPCDSSSRRQSPRMSGSREAWVCTKSSGRPGAKAATSRATIHERYFCAVATSSSTSQAGSTASRRSRLRLASLGRPGSPAAAPGRLCVSGSGQSTSTMFATAGDSLRTTRACIASSGSHDRSTSRAATTIGFTVVGRATSPAAVTSPPANALTSVLLPVPVPPTTPTTSTRESSRRTLSSRAATPSHSFFTRRAGAQAGPAGAQRPSASTRASKAAKSGSAAIAAGVGSDVDAMISRTPASIRRATAAPGPVRAANRKRRAGQSPPRPRRAPHRGASRPEFYPARPTSPRRAAR